MESVKKLAESYDFLIENLFFQMKTERGINTEENVTDSALEEIG